MKFDDLAAHREVVHMVMLHTDLKEASREGFDALVERELSSHFTIDFDGTIYQGLDAGYRAFHGGVVHSVSIGIDLTNLMPNLATNKHAKAPPYSSKHPRAAEMAKHPRKKSELMKINGGRVQSYGYTDAQYRSLGTLVRALAGALPRIGKASPTKADGDEIVPNVIAHGELFEGIVGHWHLSPTRWDPGPGLG